MDELKRFEYGGNVFYYNPKQISLNDEILDALFMTTWINRPYFIEVDVWGNIKLIPWS